MTNRTMSASSGSDLTCPRCSSTVDETTNSIGYDKSACWLLHTCTKIPTEALTYKCNEGLFCFCRDCTKTLRKLERLKATGEMDFTEDINILQEMKSILLEMKAESIHSIILPQPKLVYVNNESSPKIDTSLEIKTSVMQNFL